MRIFNALIILVLFLSNAIAQNSIDSVKHIEVSLDTVLENTNKEITDFMDTVIGINLEMIYVEGGTFLMGCTNEQVNDCGIDENPVFQVSLSDFYIGRYEITVAQFEKFIDDTQYKTDADLTDCSWLFIDGDWNLVEHVNWRCDVNGNEHRIEDYNYPVSYVSWNDAIAFCKWLSDKSGKIYRLPTEAEWEYSARGGSKDKSSIYAGSDSIDSVAWYRSNSHASKNPVGAKMPNELGIFDMSGNVSEWCCDYKNEYSSYSKINPKCVKTSYFRVIRGGSWLSKAEQCRVSYRDYSYPENRYSIRGFRVVHSDNIGLYDIDTAESQIYYDKTGTLIDTRDGKTYKTIVIGSQIWMAENLNYLIGKGGWCYNNDNSNCNKYGRLYNWETANKVCPSGWHLPSKSEFEKLINNYAALDQTVCFDLMEGGKSGFSALLGGRRGSSGNFVGFEKCGYWWSSSEFDDKTASLLFMDNDYGISTIENFDRIVGASVRCVKD